MPEATTKGTHTPGDPNEPRKPHWDSIKDEEVLVDYHNHTIDAILGPPLEDRQLEVINAITYSRDEEIKRVFVGPKSMPEPFQVDNDLLQSKASEESYPCRIVQSSNFNQFVIIDDDVYRVTGCTISGDSDDQGHFYEVRIKFDHVKPVAGIRG